MHAKLRLCARVIGLSLVVVAILLVPMHAMAAVTTGIRGTVTDSATHLPIAGATVTFNTSPGGVMVSAVTTANDGTYVANLTPGASCTLWVTAQYYGLAITSPVAVTQDVLAVQDVTLVRQLLPIYRFFNYRGVYFYTADETEKNNVIAKLGAFYKFEGLAWTINLRSPLNNMPLYRFYNKRRGVHFYTMDPVEKAKVMTNPSYRYEGIAYFVSTNSNGTPVYRYYNPKLQAHFYSILSAPRIASSDVSKSYHYEGIAFWLGNAEN